MDDIDELFSKVRKIFSDNWRLDSLCFEYDQELFFDKDQYSAGKKICDNCPVIYECLDDSMHNGDEGLRGGMSEDERISLFLYRKRHSSVFKYDMSLIDNETSL